MMAKKSLFLWTMLLSAGMAFAVNGSGYYNLFSIRTGSGLYESISLVLSQDATPCTNSAWSLNYNNVAYVSDGRGNVGYNAYTPGGWGYFYPTVTFYKTGECVAAVRDTPANLKSMLDAQWVDSDTYKGRALSLGSNIDLGEYTSTTRSGACDVNHTPLTMPQNVEFNGNGFTVSHLCYSSTSPMTQPVGLFESVDNSLVQNFTLSGIRVVVGGSSNGVDYYPVGALAGIVTLSTVDKVVLADDSIQAPFAGGLAGLANNSTFSNITGNDDIYISNKVSVTDSFAGAKVVFSDLNRSSFGNKIFLGGLVGVVTRDKANATFINDSIKVEVQNLAGDNAAVGGIAGLFSGVGDSVMNVHVYNKVKTNETIYSVISGGTSMGGFFGMAAPYVEYQTPRPGDLFIQNSSFSGKIYGGRTDDFIAAGGFIGRDSLIALMSVEIKNSRSSAEISDSLAKAGNYRYYAGGFVGVTSKCISSGDPMDFLSIVGSSAKGSINFAASAKSVPNLHARSYVGGFAGSACLASKQNGLYNDTSAVRIYVNNRTAFDGGSSVGDSVNVGGFIGRANTAVSDSFKVENLYFTGKVVVADSLNDVYVGGIVGNFPEADGGKTINFKNILVNTDTVVDLRSAAASKGSAVMNLTAKLGGVCGFCKSFSQAENIGINGGMYANSSYSGDSLIVGGLLGEVFITSDKPEGSVFNVRNTYTIGDIKVSAKNGVVEKGYLFGFSSVNKPNFDIRSNYHYGEDDGDVDAIGYMFADGNIVDNWKVSNHIHYVIRNGVTSKYTGVHHDGTMTVDSMKTSFFAGFLNAAYDNKADYAWTYVAGKNSNLPFLVDLKNKAIDPSDEITCTVTFVNKNGETIKQVSHLLPGASAEAPTEDEVMENVVGYTWNGEWDKEFDNVTSDMTVTALYSPITYKVVFKTPAGNLISDTVKVKYGEAAAEPAADEIEQKGYVFLGWRDSSYLNVTKDLEVVADYMAIKYKITFMNGDSVIKADSIPYGEEVPTPTELTKASTDGFTYSFKGWSPDVTPVSGDAVYNAVFEATKKQFTVVFVDSLGNLIGDASVVDYGDAAVVPSIPEKEGRIFVKWMDSSFVKVTKDLKIVAQYDTIMYRVIFKNHEGVVIHDSYYKYHADMSIAYPLARSATESYSYEFKGWSPELGILTSDMEVVAVYDSTYIGPTSSSEPESSSSSEEPASSSSSYKLLENMVAGITQKQSGNAIRLNYNAEIADPTLKTSVLVKLSNEKGLLIDSVLVDSLETLTYEGSWEMVQVPAGKYTVELVVTNDSLDDSKLFEFEVESKIVVASGSWNMVSIAAMDMSGVDMDSDASFYWWDEENPVGDYWQYRAYNGEEVEATRGFWYGTADGRPIVLNNADGDVASEIVWNLDSLFSGWNMVANPYGWYVNLENGKTDNDVDVKFWSWDSETASYKVATVVGPYEAVWAQVKKSTTFRVSSEPDYDAVKDMDVPPSPSQKKAAMHKNAARKASASSWTLAVSLSDENGKSDSWNVLGAGSEAETMSEPPVGMGERVTLAIRETEKGSKLAKSIKPAAESYEWILDVSANRSRAGKVSFDGIGDLNDLGYSLYVTADGVTRELKDGESLPVALKKTSQKMTVRVASANAMAVASSNLNGFRTVQNAGALQVGFTASESLAGARGHYALVSVNGKKVAGGNFTASAGSNVLNMDAPKSGLYFMQVKVGSQTMNAKVMVK